MDQNKYSTGFIKKFYKRWLQFEHHIPNFHMDQLSSQRSSLLPPCHSLPTMTSDATWSWSSSWSDQSFKVPRIGEFLELIVRWEFRLINFIQLQCTNIKSSIILFINPTWYKIFFETVKNPFQLQKRHKNDAKILIF